MKHLRPTLLLLPFVLPMVAQSAPVENFGQNLTALNQAFANRSVHILQIGDSHTAGDYFTEQLRKRLQAELGDGGVGFAPAGRVHNQRTARHDYVNGDWNIINSRTQSGDFALGGIMATNAVGGSFGLTSQYYAGDTQFAKLVVKGRAGQTVSIQDGLGSRQFVLPHTGWQVINTQVKFPANINGDVSLGGFWLLKGGGGVVSAMGINGTLQSVWSKWRANVSQDLATSGANLVILAYGTNEAFASNYNANAHKTAIANAITKIRQGLPNANILLINAPESLKSTAGGCGVRGTHLDSVRTVIREAAQQYGTLYWDWQSAMGGACSMKSWINQGLAARDGVHFTRAGYEKAANDLYYNLKIALAGTTANPTHYAARQTPVIQGQVIQGQTVQYPNYAAPNQPYVGQPKNYQQYQPVTPSYVPPKQGVCLINGQPCSSIR